METTKLKKFAQFARRSLLDQVSTKLNWVLAENSAARRENPTAVAKIEKQIFDVAGQYTDNFLLTTEQSHRRAQLVDRVAYLWFNRFCALRFMDVNRYNRMNIISPADPSQFQPEILAEAKSGHIDEDMVHDKIRQQIFALFEGRVPSRDPQGEAYRLLVVSACNFFHRAMPFLFGAIADYTELLMPDDLLSGNSILADTREAMTPDVCEDVEVIGWLYQFYISEKKDEVMARKSAVPTEDIPAVTQLFTPHWIVRYLVENSLGRLWLLNHPDSKLREHMPYYIEGEAETDFLKISTPENIRLLDPAAGSGHMLTYAFDLLYLIYEETGAEPSEIAEKILTHNLYGIEIDERAGELAAFALTMKARAKQRRFFIKGIKPNICVLENITFSDQELNEYMDAAGRDLFTQNLREALTQFEQAKNFGSLIQPCLDEQAIASVRRAIEANEGLSGQLFLRKTHLKVLRVLEQAEALTQRYHVVVANPPYMGTGKMGKEMQVFAKACYPDEKADLYSMFIGRCLILTLNGGVTGLITMHSWMFLDSFEQLREKVIQQYQLATMLHLGPRAFDSISGEVVQSTVFTIRVASKLNRCADFFRVLGGENSSAKESLFLKRTGHYRLSPDEFQKLPGSPMSYWIADALRHAFTTGRPLSAVVTPKKGLITSDNGRFLRLWHEVGLNRTAYGCESRTASVESGRRWFPYNKGGGRRKWFGSNDYFINWEKDGEEVIAYAAHLYGSASRQIQNKESYFRPSVTWTAISSSGFTARYCDQGFVFDSKGPSIFGEDADLKFCLGLLISEVGNRLLGALNSTMDYLIGNVSAVPLLPLNNGATQSVGDQVEQCVSIARSDWDNFETSWDFHDQPLLRPRLKGATLAASWRNWEAQSTAAIRRMQELETENNRLFIAAYGLVDELQPEVPEAQITLARADVKKDMAAFLSYAVGCMMGRYSPDHPGLILANAGDSLREFLEKVGKPLAELTFAPDEDGVIPILDGDWFPDDITERFNKFLKVTFGDAHIEENSRFIEASLGKSIRKYFLNDFYKDHIKTYKKRPIYWLFSSPKGSFNALIYMHRYRPDTVSVVLNDYLREFRTKLTAHKNHLEAVSISASSSQSEKTKALKEIERITKMIAEMEEYEREVLYPLATEQVQIDLDDGVKVNYLKFGAALKKIVGLDAKEDE